MLMCRIRASPTREILACLPMAFTPWCSRLTDDYGSDLSESGTKQPSSPAAQRRSTRTDLLWNERLDGRPSQAALLKVAPAGETYLVSPIVPKVHSTEQA